MKNNFSINKIILFTIIIIIFYVGILVYSDLNEISNHISLFQFTYLPIIFILMGIQLLLLGFKYHRMLKKIGVNLSVRQSVKIFIAGISLIATPGGAGTAIKSQILKSKYNIPISKSLPIIFMERLTELLGILFVLSIFFLWTNLIESVIAIGLGFLFSLIMYLLVSKNKMFTSIRKILLKINKFKKLSDSLDESRESFSILSRKSVFAEMIGWSFFSKLAQFFAIYFIFLSLELDIGILNAGQIYYTSLVLGSLSLLPSGIIITESTMIAILVNHGVEISLASLLVIFTRLITTWLGTILGIIMLKIVQSEKN